MINSDKIQPRLYAQIAIAQESPDDKVISCIVFCNNLAKDAERAFLVDQLGLSDYDDSMSNAFHGVLSFNQLNFLADQKWIDRFRPALYRSIRDLGVGVSKNEQKQKEKEYLKVRFKSKSNE